MARDRPGQFSWRVFFRQMSRSLRLSARKTETEPDDVVDPWSADRGGALRSPLLDVIDEIERSALAVYADHGLPTEQGHYARAPGDDEWQFVAKHLTPEQRWAFLEAYPPQEGWTFTNLFGLGHHARLGDTVVEASRVLRECNGVREMPAALADPEGLYRAIRLGVAWSHLTSGRVPHEAAQPEATGPQRMIRKARPN